MKLNRSKGLVAVIANAIPICFFLPVNLSYLNLLLTLGAAT
jgi:hypothetical protein